MQYLMAPSRYLLLAALTLMMSCGIALAQDDIYLKTAPIVKPTAEISSIQPTNANIVSDEAPEGKIGITAITRIGMTYYGMIEEARFRDVEYEDQYGYTNYAGLQFDLGSNFLFNVEVGYTQKNAGRRYGQNTIPDTITKEQLSLQYLSIPISAEYTLLRDPRSRFLLAAHAGVDCNILTNGTLLRSNPTFASFLVGEDMKEKVTSTEFAFNIGLMVGIKATPRIDITAQVNVLRSFGSINNGAFQTSNGTTYAVTLAGYCASVGVRYHIMKRR